MAITQNTLSPTRLGVAPVPSRAGVTGGPSVRTTGSPARGAAAINAAAREKTAANQAAAAAQAATAAQTQQTANAAPSVRSLVGGSPVTQGAYETQAQTTLQGDIAGRQQAVAQQFQGGQSALDRSHASQTQATTLQAQQRQQQQAIAAQQAEQQAEIEARRMEQQAADAARRGEMELSASLQQQAEARRMTYISQLNGQTPPMAGAEGGGTVPAAASGPGGQEEAARTAAFARAKDRAGATARASVDTFRDVMAGQGKMGSSMEAGGIASLIGDAGGDINDFTRDELMMDVNRAADLEDRNYQGAIQQRGQNMGMQQSLLSLLKGGGAY